MAQFSPKRIAIDKANATLVIAVGITAFIVMFSLVASKALLSQRAYQSKVISQRETARDTLKSNLTAADELTTAYKEFSGATTNILGGNPQGDADRDGDNPRIILDALPSKYDFPALATSVEKLLKDNGYTITAFNGTDDEVAQQSASSPTDNPQAVEIPFSVEVNTNDQQAKRLVELFELSIRPMQINKLTLVGQNGELVITVIGKTYFQPEKNLDIKKELVK
ncbi:MAG TPA: hypothetical protein VD947_02610 [Patescibacteria group bacterium]|nr:hypothetical protein [Patescibacteria group bacterium]